MKKIFIYSLIPILLISFAITKSVSAAAPGENIQKSIKLDLAVYEWGSKFIPEAKEPTPKFYTIEVREGEKFGLVNYYFKDKSFELLKIISEDKIEVRFDETALVVCGEPISYPSQQNPKIITREKTCFRSRSYDAGTDIHLKIAASQESAIMPIPEPYQDAQNPFSVIEQSEELVNILHFEQADESMPPLTPSGSQPEQCPAGCICENDIIKCPTSLEGEVGCFGENEQIDNRILTGEKKCCTGLKWILPCDENGTCLMSGGWCANCGDNICKAPENKTNCPADCDKEEIDCKKTEGGELLYFYSSFCPYCDKQKPVIEEVALTACIKVKWLDINENKELVSIYKINAMPTTIFIENKTNCLKKKTGYFTYEQLKDMIYSGQCMVSGEIIPESTQAELPITVIMSEEQCPAGCICKESTATCPTAEAVAVKILTASKPTVVFIEKKSEKITNIRTEGGLIETSAGITVEENNLYLHASEGKQKIEILPAEAKINVPNEDTIEKIELKEEAQKPTYSIWSTRKTKLFSLLPITMRVETRVSAQDNKLISIEKPWWSFLAF